MSYFSRGRAGGIISIARPGGPCDLYASFYAWELYAVVCLSRRHGTCTLFCIYKAYRSGLDLIAIAAMQLPEQAQPATATEPRSPQRPSHISSFSSQAAYNKVPRTAVHPPSINYSRLLAPKFCRPHACPNKAEENDPMAYIIKREAKPKSNFSALFCRKFATRGAGFEH